VLWLHRRLGLRSNDDPPHAGEILGHFVFWSLLLEWLGPKFVSHAQGDIEDVLAYAAGSLIATLWWWRDRWMPKLLARKA
jgi:hypothetical protein